MKHLLAGPLAFLATVLLLVTCQPASAQLVPGLISGCMPLQVNAFTLQIRECYLTNSSDDGVIAFPTTTMSITDNGAWGVDRPYDATNVPGWWYQWSIGNQDGSLAATTFSPSYLGGGVILPPGYTRLRFMGAAFYITSSSAGMRRQVITEWHLPTSFLYQDHSTAHEVVVEETGGAWVSIDLSVLVPKEARVAYLSILSEVASLNGNTVQVRTPSSGDGGFPIRANQQVTRMVAVSSTQRIEVRVLAGARARIRVLGFSIFSVY